MLYEGTVTITFDSAPFEATDKKEAFQILQQVVNELTEKANDLKLYDNSGAEITDINVVQRRDDKVIILIPKNEELCKCGFPYEKHVEANVRMGKGLMPNYGGQEKCAKFTPVKT